MSLKPLAVLVSRKLTFNPETGVGVRTPVGGIYYLRPLHDSIVEHREDHVETVGTETAYTNKDIITDSPKKESCTNEAHHTSNKVSRQHPIKHTPKASDRRPSLGSIPTPQHRSTPYPNQLTPNTKDVKLITEVGKVTPGTEPGLI